MTLKSIIESIICRMPRFQLVIDESNNDYKAHNFTSAVGNVPPVFTK